MTDPATSRRCATPDDLAVGIRLADAAVALVERRTSRIGLDYSPDALRECPGGQAIEFQGPFPQGTQVCLNCDVIGPTPDPHATPLAACQAHCLDLFAVGDTNVPASPAATTFCATRARLATNFAAVAGDRCLDGACSMMGSPLDTFIDPRLRLEPVDWANLHGVTASGSNLRRTLASTGDYDAGASSSPVITRVMTGGDAYFEFRVTETNRARIAGLSSGPAPAGGVTFAGIGFAILLTDTSGFFVVENGALLIGFGAYATGDRFRVRLQDRFDGTATVYYTRVPASCTDSACREDALYTSSNVATFPVRADAMFRDFDATLGAARIVRIQ